MWSALLLYEELHMNDFSLSNTHTNERGATLSLALCIDFVSLILPVLYEGYSENNLRWNLKK
jgi:hypothetical protein